MKRLLYSLIGVWLLAIGVTACGAQDDPAPTPDPPTAVAAQAENPAAVPAAGDATTGQKLFSTTCAACHGPTGEGVQGLGKDMTKSEFIAGLSDEELIAFVKEGRRIGDPLNTTGVDMPPKGGNPALNDEQLVDIVAYIRSIHVN